MSVGRPNLPAKSLIAFFGSVCLDAVRFALILFDLPFRCLFSVVSVRVQWTPQTGQRKGKWATETATEWASSCSWRRKWRQTRRRKRRSRRRWRRRVNLCVERHLHWPWGPFHVCVWVTSCATSAVNCPADPPPPCLSLSGFPSHCSCCAFINLAIVSRTFCGASAVSRRLIACIVKIFSTRWVCLCNAAYA